MEIEDISTENGSQRQNTRPRAGQDNSSTKKLTSHSCEEESTPLLGTTPRGCCTKVKSKFRSRRCCLWSSKAALTIIIWNLIITFGLVGFLDPTFYISVFPGDDGLFVLIIPGVSYGFTGFLFLFYPLAGCLADIRWGRHKTVVNSLCFILWSLVLVVMLGGLATVGFIPLMGSDWPISLNTKQTISSVVLFVVFGLPCLFGLILFFCSLIAFNANVIQYGMDQLHDAPTDDSMLYIHWYVWTIYMGLLIVRLPIVFFSSYWMIVFALCPGLALLLLAITLCIQKYKRRWFLIESGSRNPYKLVFKVLKFAKDHTNPIHRSAFTYCEDKLPSRLDLGKEKYGGPFTNEQVENVKAFVGILCVLLTTGPTFVADFAVNGILSSMATYTYYYSGADSNIPMYNLLYFTGCLTPLIVVILIPLYLILLRPFISHYVPGMLKRMGLGMVMFLLSGLCTLLMGSFGHNCTTESCSVIGYLKVSKHFLVIQSSLNAIGYMLFNIATFEFICAQSPHSMKGLLIGTFFAIKGVFQLIGVVAVFTPVVALCTSKTQFPTCGFIYYLINVAIALIGIIAFVLVARKYQYRERDEPDNIYRYAEEYYAKAQDEPNYDYDDYDNLNVESIMN